MGVRRLSGVTKARNWRAFRARKKKFSKFWNGWLTWQDSNFRIPFSNSPFEISRLFGANSPISGAETGTVSKLRYRHGQLSVTRRRLRLGARPNVRCRMLERLSSEQSPVRSLSARSNDFVRVRFAPVSGNYSRSATRPLCAKSRHCELNLSRFIKHRGSVFKSRRRYWRTARC